MKTSTKITNIHITTPMVSTKTSTASVSGRLDLFICNSRRKKCISDDYSYWEKKEMETFYLKNNLRNIHKELVDRKLLTCSACLKCSFLFSSFFLKCSFQTCRKLKNVDHERYVFLPPGYYQQHFTIHLSSLLSHPIFLIHFNIICWYLHISQQNSSTGVSLTTVKYLFIYFFFFRGKISAINCTKTLKVHLFIFDIYKHTHAI